nr:probable F-box protein At4g22030 [Tanacetum cinerariifolium]
MDQGTAKNAYKREVQGVANGELLSMMLHSKQSAAYNSLATTANSGGAIEPGLLGSKKNSHLIKFIIKLYKLSFGKWKIICAGGRCDVLLVIIVIWSLYLDGDVSRASFQFPKIHTNSLISTTNMQKIQPNIAVTMSGIASAITSIPDAPMEALKLSSTFLDVSRASFQFPKIHTNSLISTTNMQKIQPNIGLVEEMDFGRISPKNHNKNPKVSPDALEKLYVILEAVSDRVEMHKNIGEQRNNWNSLLLTSINTITLSAVTMSGIASAITSIPYAPLEALKLSSTFLYLAATGMLIIMNKIQPSQLTEEQRNASRLHRNLNEMLHDLDANDGDINQEDLQQLFEDAEKPVYDGCPKQHGNDIDVYLSPLINDMKTLWKLGVEMYDAYMKEKFRLHAMIFCTINDFPAYCNLS